MAREYRTAKETGQAGFENAGFDNAGFGDSRNQSRNRSSQDWRERRTRPRSKVLSKTLRSIVLRVVAVPVEVISKIASKVVLLWTEAVEIDLSKANMVVVIARVIQGMLRKGDNRSRNRLYSISPERNQSSGKSGGSAGRFSNNRADNGPRFEQSSSSRNTPSFNDSGYRASYDRNSSKFSSSGQKRSVGSISRYRDGHDNRTCSPERKQTRHEGAEPSDNPWVHDKFKPSQGPGKKPNKQECEDIDESIQFELEENY
uniref:Uncharacterized protein n=1 Tax=Ditylenchus dipsaci TaxID=166011 RepID=A0A915CYB9_9BILA